MDGSMVAVHSETDGQYIVERWYECDEFDSEDNAMLSGHREVVSHVYSKPPTARYDQDVINAQEDLTNLLKEADEAHTALREAKSELKALTKDLERVPALKRINDFINGNFKYYAMPEDYSGPKILAKEDAEKQADDYDHGKVKLLTLFGDSKGDLQWRIDQYSDGSGGSKRIAHPAKTIEDARNFIHDFITKECEGNFKLGRFYTFDRCISWMQENGYKVRQEWVDARDQYEGEKNKKARLELEKKQEEIKAKLKALPKPK